MAKPPATAAQGQGSKAPWPPPAHQSMPWSTRPWSSHPSTGLCSASRCTSTTRAETAQSSSHPKAGSAGEKQTFCWCIPWSKRSHRTPAGTPGPMHSNAAFPGVGGSGDPSEAQGCCSRGARGDPLFRQIRQETPQFCRETFKQLLQGYSSTPEPESSPRSCSLTLLLIIFLPLPVRKSFTGNYTMVSVLPQHSPTYETSAWAREL